MMSVFTALSPWMGREEQVSTGRCSRGNTSLSKDSNALWTAFHARCAVSRAKAPELLVPRAAQIAGYHEASAFGAGAWAAERLHARRMGCGGSMCVRETRAQHEILKRWQNVGRILYVANQVWLLLLLLLLSLPAAKKAPSRLNCRAYCCTSIGKMIVCLQIFREIE